MPRPESVERLDEIGQMGSYQVSTIYLSRVCFPKTKKWTPNGWKQTSIMVRQESKTVVLNGFGQQVEIKAYIHKGQTNYRDSREKDTISEDEAVSELKRMLEAEEKVCRDLLEVA